MNWQVVVPAYGASWNIQQLLASIGNVDVPFLVVDNSPDRMVSKLTVPAGVEVEFHPENLGTSASWNKALKRGAKWTLILSCSSRFDERGLNGYLREAECFSNDIMLSSVRNGHAFVIGQEAVKRLGYFDENLWPAYCEDTDWHWRMHLHPILGKCAWPSIYYEGCWFIGDAVALRSSTNPNLINGPKLLAYFASKWGAEHPLETFKTPFNNPDYPLSYWPGCERLA